MPPFRPLSSRLAPAARPLGSEGLLCAVPGITERLNLFKFKRRLAAHLAMHHRRTRPRVGNVKELDVRVVQPSRVNLLGEASLVRAPQPRDVFPKRCHRHGWLVREPAISGHLAHTSSGPGHSLQVSGRSTPVRVVPPLQTSGWRGLRRESSLRPACTKRAFPPPASTVNFSSCPPDPIRFDTQPLAPEPEGVAVPRKPPPGFVVPLVLHIKQRLPDDCRRKSFVAPEIGAVRMHVWRV